MVNSGSLEGGECAVGGGGGGGSEGRHSADGGDATGKASRAKEAASVDEDEAATHTSDTLPLDKMQTLLSSPSPATQSLSISPAPKQDDISGGSAGASSMVAKPSSVRKLLCLYCERSFVSATLRQKHVERVHSVKQSRRISSRRQSQLTVTPCVYCDHQQPDNTLDDLFRHLVQEHSNRYFGCLTCKDRFLSQGMLADHNAVNHPTNDSPFSQPDSQKIQTTTVQEQTKETDDPREDPEIDEEVTVKVTRSRIKKSEEIGKKPGKLRDLRSRRLTVKSSRLALKKKEGKKLGLKIAETQQRKRSKQNDRSSSGLRVEPNSTTKPADKQTKSGSNCINPYPEFDSFYRVKKITDHSIDNLKISSLTFDDVFDKAFFNRIKCNIEENLLHHIDGKLFKNQESETRISNFEKVSTTPQESQSSNQENYGCELSLNAVTPVASLSLNSQFGEDFESQIEYGAKPSKKKTQSKKDEVHYKYFTRRKFQASILEQKENRDLSKLDMWTQLVIKKRQQKMVDDKKSAKEMLEYSSCDEYKNKLRKEELNRILDRRGPFEDLKEEASKKAALDKLNSLNPGRSISPESFLEVREVLNEILNKVFSMTEQDCESETIGEKTSKCEDVRQIPGYLNLRRSSSLPTEGDIDHSDKITLICSSRETDNFELPTNQARLKDELVELSGEWARCRMYVCAACGAKLPNMRYLLDHKNIYHQNVWVQHYEFVGNQSELYRHLSIPALGKVGAVEERIPCKLWKRSDARLCTKCDKQCNSLGELHRHVLECGGDWTWMLVRKKCKYKPFGTKSRRKRRGLVQRHRQKTEPTERKKYKKRFEGPRQKPSDAETIQRMLANLPAKRSTRKLMSFQEGICRVRKSAAVNKIPLKTVNQKKIKCGKVIYTTRSIKENMEKTVNAQKKPTASSRTLKSLNKVLSSRILDTNAKFSVKRKLQAFKKQRSARTTASNPESSKSSESSRLTRSSPRSPLKESKQVATTVKKILSSKLNIKSFFPVKKQNNEKGLTENASGDDAHMKPRGKKTDGSKSVSENKKTKSETAKNSAKALDTKPNQSSPKKTEVKLKKFKKPVKSTLNIDEADKTAKKRKLKQNLKNVLNKVKKLKLDSATNYQNKTQQPNVKDPFLDEGKQKKLQLPDRIVIPSTLETKENIADISKNASVAISFNEYNENPPIPETIFKLESDNEKSLQAKGELNFDRPKVTLETPKTIPEMPVEEATVPGEEMKPISIDTTTKSKVTPLTSPSAKPKTWKPARGLNDCIAMLTSKLQQHTDPKPVEPSSILPNIVSVFSSSTSTKVLEDPIPHKTECILKIPTFKTNIPLSIEETALDLSTKKKSDEIPSPIWPVSIEQIRLNTVRSTVDKTIEDVINNTSIHLSWDLGHQPSKVQLQFPRSSVDDIIDFVVANSSNENFKPLEGGIKKIRSPRKPRDRKSDSKKTVNICDLFKNHEEDLVITKGIEVKEVEKADQAKVGDSIVEDLENILKQYVVTITSDILPITTEIEGKRDKKTEDGNIENNEKKAALDTSASTETKIETVVENNDGPQAVPSKEISQDMKSQNDVELNLQERKQLVEKLEMKRKGRKIGQVRNPPVKRVEKALETKSPKKSGRKSKLDGTTNISIIEEKTNVVESKCESKKAPVLETHLDNLLDINEINTNIEVSTVQVESNFNSSLKSDKIQLHNEDEPHLLENKTVTAVGKSASDSEDDVPLIVLKTVSRSTSQEDISKDTEKSEVTRSDTPSEKLTRNELADLQKDDVTKSDFKESTFSEAKHSITDKPAGKLVNTNLSEVSDVPAVSTVVTVGDETEPTPTDLKPLKEVSPKKSRKTAKRQPRNKKTISKSVGDMTTEFLESNSVELEEPEKVAKGDSEGLLVNQENQEEKIGSEKQMKRKSSRKDEGKKTASEKKTTLVVNTGVTKEVPQKEKSVKRGVLIKESKLAAALSKHKEKTSIELQNFVTVPPTNDKFLSKSKSEPCLFGTLKIPPVLDNFTPKLVHLKSKSAKKESNENNQLSDDSINSSVGNLSIAGVEKLMDSGGNTVDRTIIQQNVTKETVKTPGLTAIDNVIEDKKTATKIPIESSEVTETIKIASKKRGKIGTFMRGIKNRISKVVNRQKSTKTKQNTRVKRDEKRTTKHDENLFQGNSENGNSVDNTILTDNIVPITTPGAISELSQSPNEETTKSLPNEILEVTKSSEVDDEPELVQPKVSEKRQKLPKAYEKNTEINQSATDAMTDGYNLDKIDSSVDDEFIIPLEPVRRRRSRRPKTRISAVTTENSETDLSGADSSDNDISKVKVSLNMSGESREHTERKTLRRGSRGDTKSKTSDTTENIDTDCKISFDTLDEIVESLDDISEIENSDKSFATSSESVSRIYTNRKSKESYKSDESVGSLDTYVNNSIKDVQNAENLDVPKPMEVAQTKLTRRSKLTEQTILDPDFLSISDRGDSTSLVKIDGDPPFVAPTVSVQVKIKTICEKSKDFHSGGSDADADSSISDGNESIFAANDMNVTGQDDPFADRKSLTSTAELLQVRLPKRGVWKRKATKSTKLAADSNKPENSEFLDESLARKGNEQIDDQQVGPAEPLQKKVPKMKQSNISKVDSNISDRCESLCDVNVTSKDDIKIVADLFVGNTTLQQKTVPKRIARKIKLSETSETDSCVSDSCEYLPDISHDKNAFTVPNRPLQIPISKRSARKSKSLITSDVESNISDHYESLYDNNDVGISTKYSEEIVEHTVGAATEPQQITLPKRSSRKLKLLKESDVGSNISDSCESLNDSSNVSKTTTHNDNIDIVHTSDGSIKPSQTTRPKRSSRKAKLLKTSDFQSNISNSCESLNDASDESKTKRKNDTIDNIQIPDASIQQPQITLPKRASRKSNLSKTLDVESSKLDSCESLSYSYDVEITTKDDKKLINVQKSVVVIEPLQTILQKRPSRKSKLSKSFDVELGMSDSFESVYEAENMNTSDEANKEAVPVQVPVDEEQKEASKRAEQKLRVSKTSDDPDPSNEVTPISKDFQKSVDEPLILKISKMEVETNKAPHAPDESCISGSVKSNADDKDLSLAGQNISNTGKSTEELSTLPVEPVQIKVPRRTDKTTRRSKVSKMLNESEIVVDSSIPDNIDSFSDLSELSVNQSDIESSKEQNFMNAVSIKPPRISRATGNSKMFTKDLNSSVSDSCEASDLGKSNENSLILQPIKKILKKRDSKKYIKSKSRKTSDASQTGDPALSISDNVLESLNDSSNREKDADPTSEGSVESFHRISTMQEFKTSAKDLDISVSKSGSMENKVAKSNVIDAGEDLNSIKLARKKVLKRTSKARKAKVVNNFNTTEKIDMVLDPNNLDRADDKQDQDYALDVEKASISSTLYLEPLQRITPKRRAKVSKTNETENAEAILDSSNSQSSETTYEKMSNLPGTEKSVSGSPDVSFIELEQQSAVAEPSSDTIETFELNDFEVESVRRKLPQRKAKEPRSAKVCNASQSSSHDKLGTDTATTDPNISDADELIDYHASDLPINSNYSPDISCEAIFVAPTKRRSKRTKVSEYSMTNNDICLSEDSDKDGKNSNGMVERPELENADLQVQSRRETRRSKSTRSLESLSDTSLDYNTPIDFSASEGNESVDENDKRIKTIGTGVGYDASSKQRKDSVLDVTGTESKNSEGESNIDKSEIKIVERTDEQLFRRKALRSSGKSKVLDRSDDSTNKKENNLCSSENTINVGKAEPEPNEEPFVMPRDFETPKKNSGAARKSKICGRDLEADNIEKAMVDNAFSRNDEIIKPTSTTLDQIPFIAPVEPIQRKPSRGGSKTARRADIRQHVIDSSASEGNESADDICVRNKEPLTKRRSRRTKEQAVKNLSMKTSESESSEDSRDVFNKNDVSDSTNSLENCETEKSMGRSDSMTKSNSESEMLLSDLLDQRVTRKMKKFINGSSTSTDESQQDKNKELIGITDLSDIVQNTLAETQRLKSSRNKSKSCLSAEVDNETGSSFLDLDTSKQDGTLTTPTENTVQDKIHQLIEKTDTSDLVQGTLTEAQKQKRRSRKKSKSCLVSKNVNDSDSFLLEKDNGLKNPSDVLHKLIEDKLEQLQNSSDMVDIAKQDESVEDSEASEKNSVCSRMKCKAFSNKAQVPSISHATANPYMTASENRSIRSAMNLAQKKLEEVFDQLKQTDDKISQKERNAFETAKSGVGITLSTNSCLQNNVNEVNGDTVICNSNTSFTGPEDTLTKDINEYNVTKSNELRDAGLSTEKCTEDLETFQDEGLFKDIKVQNEKGRLKPESNRLRSRSAPVKKARKFNQSRFRSKSPKKRQKHIKVQPAEDAVTDDSGIEKSIDNSITEFDDDLFERPRNLRKKPHISYVEPDIMNTPRREDSDVTSIFDLYDMKRFVTVSNDDSAKKQVVDRKKSWAGKKPDFNTDVMTRVDEVFTNSGQLGLESLEKDAQPLLNRKSKNDKSNTDIPEKAGDVMEKFKLDALSSEITQVENLPEKEIVDLSKKQHTTNTPNEEPIRIIINKQKTRRKSKSFKKSDLKGPNDLFEDFALVIKKPKKGVTPIIRFSPADTFLKDTDVSDIKLPEEQHPFESKKNISSLFEPIENKTADVSVEEMDMELDEIPIPSNIIETEKLGKPFQIDEINNGTKKASKKKTKCKKTARNKNKPDVVDVFDGSLKLNIGNVFIDASKESIENQKIAESLIPKLNDMEIPDVFNVEAVGIASTVPDPIIQLEARTRRNKKLDSIIDSDIHTIITTTGAFNKSEDIDTKKAKGNAVQKITALPSGVIDEKLEVVEKELDSTIDAVLQSTNVFGNEFENTLDVLDKIIPVVARTDLNIDETKVKRRKSNRKCGKTTTHTLDEINVENDVSGQNNVRSNSRSRRSKKSEEVSGILVTTSDLNTNANESKSSDKESGRVNSREYENMVDIFENELMRGIQIDQQTERPKTRSKRGSKKCDKEMETTIHNVLEATSVFDNELGNFMEDIENQIIPELKEASKIDSVADEALQQRKQKAKGKKLTKKSLKEADVDLEGTAVLADQKLESGNDINPVIDNIIDDDLDDEFIDVMKSESTATQIRKNKNFDPEVDASVEEILQEVIKATTLGSNCGTEVSKNISELNVPVASVITDNITDTQTVKSTSVNEPVELTVNSVLNSANVTAEKEIDVRKQISKGRPRRNNKKYEQVTEALNTIVKETFIEPKAKSKRISKIASTVPTTDLQENVTSESRKDKIKDIDSIYAFSESEDFEIEKPIEFPLRLSKKFSEASVVTESSNIVQQDDQKVTIEENDMSSEYKNSFSAEILDVEVVSLEEKIRRAIKQSLLKQSEPEGSENINSSNEKSNFVESTVQYSKIVDKEKICEEIEADEASTKTKKFSKKKDKGSDITVQCNIPGLADIVDESILNKMDTNKSYNEVEEVRTGYTRARYLTNKRGKKSGSSVQGSSIDEKSYLGVLAVDISLKNLDGDLLNRDKDIFRNIEGENKVEHSTDMKVSKNIERKSESSQQDFLNVNERSYLEGSLVDDISINNIDEDFLNKIDTNEDILNEICNETDKNETNNVKGRRAPRKTGNLCESTVHHPEINEVSCSKMTGAHEISKEIREDIFNKRDANKDTADKDVDESLPNTAKGRTVTKRRGKKPKMTDNDKHQKSGNIDSGNADSLIPAEVKNSKIDKNEVSSATDRKVTMTYEKKHGSIMEELFQTEISEKTHPRDDKKCNEIVGSTSTLDQIEKNGVVLYQTDNTYINEKLNREQQLLADTGIKIMHGDDALDREKVILEEIDREIEENKATNANKKTTKSELTIPDLSFSDLVEVKDHNLGTGEIIESVLDQIDKDEYISAEIDEKIDENKISDVKTKKVTKRKSRKSAASIHETSETHNINVVINQMSPKKPLEKSLIENESKQSVETPLQQEIVDEKPVEKRVPTKKRSHSEIFNVEAEIEPVEEGTRKRSVRSAKVKALEHIHDDALAELTESEINKQPGRKKTDEDAIASVKNTKKQGKNKLLHVIDPLDFPKDILQEKAPLLADLVADLAGLEELRNSIERELSAENDFEEAEGPRQLDEENQELRRSRRSSRKIASYNENEFDPILDALENKGDANKKETVAKENKNKNEKEAEKKLNSDELFNLLKTTATEEMYVPKPQNSFLSNLEDSSRDFNDQNFDNVFDNLLEKSTLLIKANANRNVEKKDPEKMYEFTDSPETESLSTGGDCLSKKNKRSSQCITPSIKIPIDENESMSSEPPVESKGKARANEKNRENYCEICNKSFVRVESLVKHKRTLTHIQKLSEIEAREASEKLKYFESRPETEVNDAPIAGEVNKTSNVGCTEKDKDAEHVEPSVESVTSSYSDSLRLGDSISNLLQKPVVEQNEKFVDIIMKSSAEMAPKYKRYKSLGERKSFESENSVPADSIPEPYLISKTSILEKQISLLENIIENNTGVSYDDDISVSSNNSERRVTSSVQVAKVVDESQTEPKRTGDGSFLKPAQYEEISEDSANLRNYEEQKLRKTLNRDEELFLECCSLLKSGSEVSKSRHMSKQQYAWSKEKSVPHKLPFEEAEESSNGNSRIATPLGSSYDDDASDSNTISSNWEMRDETVAVLRDGAKRRNFGFQLDEEERKPLNRDNEIFKPLDITSSENTKPEELIDVKKIMTKGARKVFEGLKVSIPTEELNMEEVLNTGQKSKKSEEVEKMEDFPKKAARKSKPVKKAQVGSNLMFKVNKKKGSPNTNIVIQSEEPEINYDVYDFEETQDNTEVFTKPDFKAFKNLKSTDSQDVTVEPSEQESDTDSRDYLDTFTVERDSSVSSLASSVVKKPKAQENITKKKCMIMGRIFKNAAKSKVEDIDEDIRAIPPIDNDELIENYVASCKRVIRNESKPKLSESEINMLFDQLLENKIESKEGEQAEMEAAPKPATAPVAPPKPKQESKEVNKKTDSKKKPPKIKGKKRARTHSDSTDDEFKITNTSKRSYKKTTKEEDNCINLELELKECIGVASRKSQRKCTSGKQNVLVEYWSSDDSQFEAMLESQKIVNKTAADTEPAETVPEPKEKLVEDKPNPVMEKELEEKLPKEKKVQSKKTVTAKKKKQRPKDAAPGDGAVATEEPLGAAAAQTNRRKRAATNPLYHWSSSSEDESQDLIEVKPIRDEPEDDEDRPIQHGWIVGDSPKKLVTMLAQAKGKKTDADTVKEQGKKRTASSAVS